MEESKIELNKLIASYRGSIIVQRYHAEWHHLMPVVQKIDKFLDENLLEDFWKAKGIYWQHSRFKLMTISTPIDIVYKRVVEFIKWHNNTILVNKSKNELYHDYETEIKKINDL